MNTPDDFTGPVNLGNPVEFSTGELAKIIIKMTGSKSKVVHLPLPVDDPRQRRPDITLAKKALDWQPVVGLEEGLEKTVKYFRKNIGIKG
jgi:UDP-glucuronate decarboxylase